MDFWRTYLHIPPTVQETEREIERVPENLHKRDVRKTSTRKRLPEDPSVAQ